MAKQNNKIKQQESAKSEQKLPSQGEMTMEEFLKDLGEPLEPKAETAIAFMGPMKSARQLKK